MDVTSNQARRIKGGKVSCMDDLNKYILIQIKRSIEDAMENEIDEDEFIPTEIIKLLAALHSNLHVLIKE